MMDYFKRVQSQTPTRFWINNVTRKQAALAIEAGAVGCTQNPAYTWKMMQDPAEHSYVMQKLDAILADESDDNMALIRLQKELVYGVAELFMPIYEASRGRDGYVCIQGSPFDESAESIVKYGKFNTTSLPNLTAKVPVTKEGLLAIRELAMFRIPINATEIMTVPQAMDVADVYDEVCSRIDSPAPMFYSVITGVFDEYLQNEVAENNITVSPDALWQAGTAIAKKAYWLMKERRSECKLICGGAKGLHHFTEMVGAECIITINWHGTADKLIEQNPPVLQRFFMPTPYSAEAELFDKIETFRSAYFVNRLTSKEYEDFGPVVLFHTSFESAWKNALNEVVLRRKS